MTIARTGTLLVGWDAGDRRLLEQFIHTASEFGAPTQKVSRRDKPRLFEGVTHRIDDGIVMNDDAWINPDEVVSFLLNALDVLGAQIVEQEVLEVHTHARGVSVTCASGEFSADCGILATGARRLPSGVASGAGNAVRPIRGVTVRVQGIDRSDLPTVRAYVRGRAFYMVSRTNGYCVLGASAEERAENVLEVGELQRLLRDALDIIPELETAHLIETRMGLRPASPNLEPFFEVVAPNAWAWSSGHYRHGVTLAPLAALQALSFVEAVA
jgi:glycine oxidase